MPGREKRNHEETRNRDEQEQHVHPRAGHFKKSKIVIRGYLWTMDTTKEGKRTIPPLTNRFFNTICSWNWAACWVGSIAVAHTLSAIPTNILHTAGKRTYLEINVEQKIPTVWAPRKVMYQSGFLVTNVWGTHVPAHIMFPWVTNVLKKHSSASTFRQHKKKCSQGHRRPGRFLKNRITHPPI